MNQQTMTDRHTSFENFGDQFGVLTFTGDVMLRCLDAKVFEKLNRTMEHGTALDPAIANQVADSMKEWALEHGCTHYCHWFQLILPRACHMLNGLHEGPRGNNI